MKIDGLKLREAWGSSIVARREIKKFSGGALNPGTMANFDCLGTGPAGRFKVGRKVCYPIDEVISWVEDRTEEVG